MIEKDITDTVVQQHLAEISRDAIDLFLLSDSTVRLVVAHATSLVNQARVSHDLESLEAALLGEALMATALGGSNLKENEMISCLLESDGPLGGFVTDVNRAGHVRGYLRTRGAVSGDDAGADLLGSGWLDLVRSDEDRTHVSRGHVEWLPGSVSSNVERYYRISEQIPTAVRIGTHRDGEGRILGAAALLIQRMPGGKDEAFRELQAIASLSESPAQQYSLGRTTPEIVRELFRDWNPKLVSTRNVEFYCACSRERFARFLRALPAEEARDILKNGPIPLVTTCYNCSSEYSFTGSELQEIFGRSL